MRSDKEIQEAFLEVVSSILTVAVFFGIGFMFF